MRRGRRSIRLAEYDYASPGAYFVTIATQKKEPIFGRVVGNEIALNEWGKIAEKCWHEIPNHFSQVSLDQFIVMPNHVHGIVFIDELDSVHPKNLEGQDNSRVGAQHAAPLRQDKVRVYAGSLGAIVRSFKSAVTKAINELRKPSATPIWQRNYYERVIRDEPDLEQIRSYIAHNAIPH